MESHLVFLPDQASPRFFVWGAGAETSALAPAGMPGKALLVDETLHAHELEGLAVPLLRALPRLAAMDTLAQERLPPSWT